MYESADSPSLPSPHAALPDTIETFADQVLLITWLSHQFCLTCVVEQIPAGRSYAYVTSRRIAL